MDQAPLRVCAKQTLAKGLFNERERLLGLSRVGFCNFDMKFYGRQIVLLNLNTAPACSSACHASCSLRSAVTISSRCARSAASARISASRNPSKALVQSDWAQLPSRGAQPSIWYIKRPMFSAVWTSAPLC